MKKNNPMQTKQKMGERSFTLIETVIALGLMVSVIFEVSGVQGNAIYFNEYERNVTKATWLAKGVMSKIEYEWKSRPFSEFEVNETEKPFEGDDKEFTYTVNIAEWKLPLMSLIGGGGGDKEDEDSKEDSGAPTDMIGEQIKSILGDDIIKIAKVEVFWPEGIHKNSVDLTLVLTNQKKLDEQIATLPPPKAPGKPPPKDPNDKTPPPPPKL